MQHEVSFLAKFIAFKKFGMVFLKHISSKLKKVFKLQGFFYFIAFGWYIFENINCSKKKLLFFKFQSLYNKPQKKLYIKKNIHE